MFWERMSGQQEQDSNPGGWKKGRFITLVDQYTGSLQKWHRPHSSGLRGFLCLRMWKQASRKAKADVAVSLSLGGYNISH
jgi:hypothetical protein